MKSRKMVRMTLFPRQESRCRHRVDMWTQSGKGGRTNWEIRIDVCTLPCINVNRLLVGTCSKAEKLSSCSVMTRMGGMGAWVGGRVQRKGMYVSTRLIHFLYSRN